MKKTKNKQLFTKEELKQTTSKQEVKLDKNKQKVKASHIFVSALALVSIIGFISIISSTLFDYNLTFYAEAFLMLIIGIALIFEGQITKLTSIKEEGLTPRNFTQLTTVIVGVIAVIAGIFSLPIFRIGSSGFLAIKGILSVIAIVIIVIQTWIIE